MGPRSRSATLSLACLLAALGAAPALADPSQLWGEAGERWDPYGRLPDYSYAGYRAGREPIPDVPVVTNVRDFGAVGDGVTDDTDAFRAAIAATEDGALLVPAGRYLIRDVLTIDRDDVVIRGEGPDATVLYIDRSLTDLNGGVRDRNFSWSGGFLVVGGGSSPTGIGAVTAPARRGDRWLELETVEGIAAGDLILIELDEDADGSLGRHMHNEQEEAERCSGSVRFDWRSRVASVDVEHSRIELDEPLPVDVRLEWSPDVRVMHYLSGAGIEHLAIEFPSTPYPGHLNELGYNAIRLSGVVDVWVRDVDITNADSGIFVSGKHVTVEDVGFYADRPADGGGDQGHHGVGSSQSCLFTGLHFQAQFRHSLTVSNQAARNVFADIGGSAVVTMDHHRRTPIENLFTAFTGRWSYRSGGSGCEGPHAGARNSYWGLEGPAGPPCNVGGSGQCWGHIQSNVVGELAMDESLTDEREWYESVSELAPRNLYVAQLARRLAIEDRGARFSPLRYGLRSQFDEQDRFRWAVLERDGDARYALATTVHRQKEGERLGEYALARTPALGDVTVTARAASNEPLDSRYPDLCLIVGYQDDDNYDYVMFNGEPASSAIFAVRDGQRRELANAGRALITDRAWHTIAARRTGAQIEMLWDGDVVASTEGVADAPAPIAGRVGVGTYNDAAFFDDIEIASPDLPEEEPDAGPVSEDGGVQIHDDAGAPPSAPSGGCGCRVGASGSSGAAARCIAVVFLLMVGWRARRGGSSR